MKLRTVAVLFVVSLVSGLAAVGGSAFWLWTQLYQYRSPEHGRTRDPRGPFGP